MGDERGEYDTDSEEEGECGDSEEEAEGGHNDEDEEGHEDEDSCDPNGLFDALAAAQEAAER